MSLFRKIILVPYVKKIERDYTERINSFFRDQYPVNTQDISEEIKKKIFYKDELIEIHNIYLSSTNLSNCISIQNNLNRICRDQISETEGEKFLMGRSLRDSYLDIFLDESYFDIENRPVRYSLKIDKNLIPTKIQEKFEFFEKYVNKNFPKTENKILSNSIYLDIKNKLLTRD